MVKHSLEIQFFVLKTQKKQRKKILLWFKMEYFLNEVDKYVFTSE